MPYLTVGEHPRLLVKNLDTAPLRANMALQVGTGKKLAEIREEAEYSETLRVAMVAFLTLQSAGIFETWEQLIERPVTAFVFVETEKEKVERIEKEEAEAAEEAAAADPLSTPTDSQHNESDGETSTDPAANESPSKKTNRGSKGKSTSE